MTRTILTLITAPAALLLLVASASAAGDAAVRRELFQSGARYLVVETLDDDLFHFELAEKRGEIDPMHGIYTTPMVARTDYPGPTAYHRRDNIVETAEAAVTVDPQTLCVEIRDTRRGIDLARICGEGLHRTDKTLAIEPRGMRNVYGIGNFFHSPPSTDGDWAGRDWHATGYGSVRRPAHGAAPSESQFPVLYALGRGTDCFALFLDHVYRISWDFGDDTRWTASTWGDQLRFYVMTGADLKDLRKDFMELTGFPRIPPRSTFGLWVSKFGYLNWDDLRLDIESLRKNAFPVDGFALDLQWFGGTFNDATNARMGKLWFDARNFAQPEPAVKRLREKLGIRLMLVEEAYVDERLQEYRLLTPPAAPRCFLARKKREGCVPVQLGTEQDPLWWGRGGMIDWTDPAAGKYWHDLKRLRLSLLGVTSHWLDLGEPEMFEDTAWYHGIEPGKQRHIDIHNMYNFLWAASIHEGYRDSSNRARLMKELGLSAPPRYFSMSRAGAPGMQRFSAGMWTGDIGRNMGSLRAHLNTQLHMSLAGIDYYNSDVGGYIGTHGFGIEPEHTDAELYTQWFADSALGEIPLRPHGWSYSGEIPTFGPDRQGHRESNRANLLQRYEIFPYVYSLAHRASRFGEPMFPPLVYHFQGDLKVRGNGNVKMIGPDLLYGVVAGFRVTERRIYLPKGEWVNYNTHDRFLSRGEETPELPLYMPRYVRDLQLQETTPAQKTAYLDRGAEGVALTLPLFARAGAIIPVMYTDAETLNLSGARSDGTTRNELRVKVFSSADPTSFTLYEDDGETVAYETGAVMETVVSQQRDARTATVAIAPSSGTFAGAPSARSYVVQLVAQDSLTTAVELNGAQLPRCGSMDEFEKSGRACWINGGRHDVLARSARTEASAAKRFVFSLEAAKRRSSAHFVCESSGTQPGEAVFVIGNVPQLGEWDPARGVRMIDIRYPTWSVVVDDLPNETVVEWKCIRRDEKGTTANQIEPGPNHSVTTSDGGFAGTSRGRLQNGDIRAIRAVTN